MSGQLVHSAGRCPCVCLAAWHPSMSDLPPAPSSLYFTHRVQECVGHSRAEIATRVPRDVIRLPTTSSSYPFARSAMSAKSSSVSCTQPSAGASLNWLELLFLDWEYQNFQHLHSSSEIRQRQENALLKATQKCSIKLWQKKLTYERAWACTTWLGNL